MNIIKLEHFHLSYLILSLAIATSGTVFAAEQETKVEAEKECEVEIKKMHAATTVQELVAAKNKGILGRLLIEERDSGTHFYPLLDSILLNPKAGAELIDFCAQEGIVSSRGHWIEVSDFEFVKLIRYSRETVYSLLARLLMNSNGDYGPLNSLSELQNKCKKIAALTASPLRLRTNIQNSYVKNFEVDTVRDSLEKLYVQLQLTRHMSDDEIKKLKKKIRYILAMCKGIDEAYNEYTLNKLLPLQSSQVDIINQYDADKNEAAKLKPLLDDPRAQPYLKEIKKFSARFLKKQHKTFSAQ